MLSWRIDPDGALGIRQAFESPYRPGETVTADDYYGWMFEHRVPGLPETAAQAFVVAFIGCLVLGASDTMGVVFSARFLLSSTELTRQAERAMAATGGKNQTNPCVTPVGPLDSFGTPATVCAVPDSMDFAFADDPRGVYTLYRGRLFRPGQKEAPHDICVRGLGRNWWEYTTITFPDCPPGFGFRGFP